MKHLPSKSKQNQNGLTLKTAFSWLLRILLVAVQFLTSAFLLRTLLNLHILASWQFAAILFVLAFLAIVSAYVLLLKPRVRTIAKIASASLSVLTILATLFVFSYAHAIDHFLNATTIAEPTTTTTRKTITDEPFTLYLSGSDSRTGINDNQARSDVNILAVVNPSTRKLLLINIPRDYYVQLAGTDPNKDLKDKLTHAGIYGIEKSKATIENLLDVEIDHTVKISFDTVTSIVDAIDGITINSDKNLNLKTESGETCALEQGINSVNGACALRFARERKSYESGDRHRGENQEQVIEKIVAKISSDKILLLRLPQILAAAENTFRSDFTKTDITSLIKSQLENPASWEVETANLDGAGDYQPTYTMGTQKLYVMLPDEETINKAKKKILEIEQS